MDIELTRQLQGTKRNQWLAFLAKMQLEADEQIESTVLIWDDGELIATASRQEGLLKCIAVDSTRQGEGLTATLITQLRQDAFAHGYKHLFLYTKPENIEMFRSLFFYPITQTDRVLLMENQPEGIQNFLQVLPAEPASGTVGAVVMNGNPFTKGHRYLIETAAKDCDRLYVFVLSEDKSEFSAADRLAMAKAGTADLPNVTVLSTGPYLISSATFPTYFLKGSDKIPEIHCLLDIQIFAQYYAKHLHITRRYVGTEPFCRVTNRYNETLKEHLPTAGISLIEIPRISYGDTPISASDVRTRIAQKDWGCLENLLPATTLDYIKHNHLLK